MEMSEAQPDIYDGRYTVCTAAITRRNHFFCLYQQNQSSASEVKFRQASNRSKRVYEAAKLDDAN